MYIHVYTYMYSFMIMPYIMEPSEQNIHTQIHRYIHTFVQTYIHTYIYTYTHVYTYMYSFAILPYCGTLCDFMHSCIILTFNVTNVQFYFLKSHALDNNAHDTEVCHRDLKLL